MGTKSDWTVRIHSLPGYDYPMRLQPRDNRIMIRDEKTSKYGFCNCYGDVVVPCVYDMADPYAFGCSVVYKNKVYGLIDQVGSAVVPLTYELIDSNGDGTYLAVIDDGNLMWGMLDYHGNTVIPFVYENFRDIPRNIEGSGDIPCNNHRERELRNVSDVYVEVNDEPTFLNQLFENGVRLPIPLYFFHFDQETEDDLDYNYLRESKFIPIYDWGVMDSDGNVLVPPEYVICGVACGKGPIGVTAKHRGDSGYCFIEFLCEEESS